MGVKSALGPQACPQKIVARKKSIPVMLKRMVSMATHNAILLNGGVPTTITISQLLLSLDL